MILLIIYWTILLACSVYVAFKGAGPERTAMSILVLGSAATEMAVSDSLGHRFLELETGIFAVDVIVLLAFLLLALRADRFWPLWITGIHLVGVATHTAKLMSPTVVPWVYGWVQGFWAYPIIVLIVIGTARHRKRLKRFGVDNSWRGSSVVPGRMTPRHGPSG